VDFFPPNVLNVLKAYRFTLCKPFPKWGSVSPWGGWLLTVFSFKRGHRSYK